MMLAVLGAFGGTKILVDPGMVDWKEDWSKVRSPGRARRRMRKGHKQNIQRYSVPKTQVFVFDNGATMVMHPDIQRQLIEMTNNQHTRER